MWNAVLNARASRVGEASSVVDASASVTDSNRCASRYARRASATSPRSPPVVPGDLPERDPDLLGQQVESGFRQERVVDAGQRIVQAGDVPPQGRVGELGPVDRRADQVPADERRLEVQDPLAVSGTVGGSAVMDHVRRKHRHHRATSAAGPPIEVIPDRPLVDDEERPRVMCVWRIRVAEPRVEHLPDTRDRRPPRLDIDRG
jgi:hypothetical protein